MAIRMRRGNEADFDPSKMLPGEWAVSTDTKYVRMCFSPGIVLRMATYEAFESDMAEMRKILSECQSIQTAIELIQKNVTNSELVIENYVKEAKQYRDEAEQFRNEASMFAPEGYEDLVKNVSDNTVKIDTIIEKAELNIKNNAKGSNIHLTDSADSNVVALELYGKTEQNAYTGKNLLDCSGLTETTTNGVKFTPKYDSNGSLEYINANGTASADVMFRLNVFTFDAKDYVLSGCPSGGNYSTYMMYVNQSYDTGNGVNMSFTETVTYSVWIRIVSGFTLTNAKFYPMISLEGGEYEPYVGGMPSPNPDYPQEIKSVKGKNLLDCRGLTEQTTNGVTFTPVYDDNGNLLYVNVNGTASERADYVMNDFTLSTGKYILNGCPSGGVASSYRLRLSFYNDDTFVSATDDYGSGSTFNYDTKSTTYNKMRCSIIIMSGTVCNNLKFYPMIRLASIKDDTYVPYGLLRIKTHGKNLIKGSQTFEDFDRMSIWTKETETYNGLTVLSKNTAWDGVFKKNFYVESGKTYTFSAFVKTSENHSAQLYLLYTNISTAKISINSKPIDCTTEWKRFSIKFTCTKSGLICPRVESITDGVRIYVCGYQVEESPTMTEYQPYQETEITLSEPIELNGFNGVYDVVTSDGVTRRFAEYTITGDENIYLHANGRIYVNIDSLYNKLKPQSNLLCTIASNDNDVKEHSYGYYCHLGGAGVYFTKNDSFSTAEEFIEYVKSNTVKCIIELATPTTEELQSDFTALKTFYPETHVSNDADCDMSITYTADAKNYIDNKIALLTTAIYNNI